MDDLIEKVKRALRCCDCHKSNCEGCGYCSDGLVGIETCTGNLASDALSVIEEQEREIEKLTPKNDMNLKELWEKARNGETLSENEWKFIIAGWDERNGYNQPKEGDGETDATD